MSFTKVPPSGARIEEKVVPETDAKVGTGHASGAFHLAALVVCDLVDILRCVVDLNKRADKDAGCQQIVCTGIKDAEVTSSSNGLEKHMRIALTSAPDAQ
jgi:hypothetical protein